MVGKSVLPQMAAPKLTTPASCQRSEPRAVFCTRGPPLSPWQVEGPLPPPPPYTVHCQPWSFGSSCDLYQVRTTRFSCAEMRRTKFLSQLVLHSSPALPQRYLLEGELLQPRGLHRLRSNHVAAPA